MLTVTPRVVPEIDPVCYLILSQRLTQGGRVSPPLPTFPPPPHPPPAFPAVPRAAGAQQSWRPSQEASRLAGDPVKCQVFQLLAGSPLLPHSRRTPSLHQVMILTDCRCSSELVFLCLPVGCHSHSHLLEGDLTIEGDHALFFP